METEKTYCKGHISGYITDGNTFPADSVQEGTINMDFEKDFDSLRPPYKKVGEIEILNFFQSLSTDYKIIGFTEKLFIDNDNNENVCLIVVVKHNINHSIKIFTNKYYYASGDYGNNSSVTVGWITQWTELSEIAKLNYNVIVTGTSTTNYNRSDFHIIKTLGNEVFLNKPENYYKGWFMYDSRGDCIGQITEYAYVPNDKGNFSVALNSRVNAGDTAIESVLLTSYTQGYHFSRFPVNMFAYNLINNISGGNEFEDVTQCSFESAYNSVKICIGNKLRPIELTFIQGFKFDTENDYKRGWNGLWLAYDIPKVDDIDILVKKKGVSGDTDIEFFVYDELGVRIQNQFTTYEVTSEYLREMAFAVCLTLKGYQMIFVKYFIGEAYTISSDPYIYSGSNNEVHFLTDFDRRITAINRFGGVFEVGTLNYDTLTTFRYPDDTLGNYKIEKAPLDNIEFVSPLNYYVGIGEIANVPDIIIAPAYLPGEVRFAKGITLGASLNSKYYHSPVSAFSIIFKVGQNLIGADLSPDYLEIDNPLHDSFGGSKIVVSQLQYQGFDGTPVNAESCYGEERIQHLISGEKIVAGMQTINNRFVLFTDRALYGYEIVAEGKLSIREDFSKLLFKGTYNTNTVVRAVVGDQYAGLFWIGKDSIYRMRDTAPEDILFLKWKDEYQATLDSDKAAAVCGFNARTKNVFFKIGAKIYVWNLDYEHWRVYNFSDSPEQFVASYNGETLFSSGVEIFQTDKRTDDLFIDKYNVGIPLKYVKKVNNESFLTNKIPDLLKLVFESDVSEITDYPTINLQIKLGSNGLTDNHFNKIVTITGATKYSTINPLRIPARNYQLEISSIAGTEINIKYFKLKEFLLTAKRTVQEILK